MEAEQPIIVIKKKSGHGGHHGGAWKVAYADFVTAMMSLFIVLWLMSSTSKATQEEIAGYFRDPSGVSTKKGGNGKVSSPEVKKDDMAELKKDLTKAIESVNALNKLKKQIEISVTEEGLRIELLEDEKGTFFEVGSAKPTPVLEELLKVLAGQLKGLPNKLSIEGHTDSQPYSKSTGYGNWELSSDRANEARREMQGDGIRLNQVSQVRGFADQRLHVPSKPFDPANRRVSLVVQNLTEGDGKKGKEPAQELAEGPKVASPQVEAKGDAAVESKVEAKAELGKGETTSSAMVVAPALVAKPSAGLMSRAMGMFHKK